MKSKLTSIAASGLFATLAFAQPPHYKLTDLGPVGGTPGQPYFITSNGLVAGAAATADGRMHGVLWYKGQKRDIGTPGLGGPNSTAFGVNERGQVVGEAQSSIPNGEDFCGFTSLGLPPSATACLPFVWQNGMMTKLATLGGANGVANLNNSRGEVVGFAETNTIDAACPGISEFKPVVWASGKIQELPTFPGDSDGGAFGINDNGQVVGSSGPCTPGFNPQSQVYFVPVHALLWQNGAATDLGNLGGDGGFAGNHACAINNRGQVVGHSDLTDDATAHAFLWTRETRMSDLGTIPGDFASFALGINDRGEVVGASVDANFNPRAFLWDNGAMVDINTLIPANSGLSLQLAESINSSGEIVGFGQTSTGEVHGFLATPATSGDDREDGLAAARPGAPAIASERARKLLFQRLRIPAR